MSCTSSCYILRPSWNQILASLCFAKTSLCLTCAVETFLVFWTKETALLPYTTLRHSFSKLVILDCGIESRYIFQRALWSCSLCLEGRRQRLASSQQHRSGRRLFSPAT
uniref:Putative secreted protein n=1 Tax=Ixodes ricinus TaxID=34613 RepID=A0A6B0UI07_IXORI